MRIFLVLKQNQTKTKTKKHKQKKRIKTILDYFIVIYYLIHIFAKLDFSTPTTLCLLSFDIVGLPRSYMIIDGADQKALTRREMNKLKLDLEHEIGKIKYK